MYIEKIKLVNFRNYEHQEIVFSKNKNLLFGNNAQGKTNLLEAIYICSVGKSHRFSKDNELLFFGKDGYYIEIYLIKNKRNYKIEVGFDIKKGKRIKAGGVELKKIGELLGRMVVVMFSPDDLRMIKDRPEHRRRFLDIFICQVSATYLFDLQQYQKILEQRNNLLKQINIKHEIHDTIDIWDEKLMVSGSRIVCKRIDFVKKIACKANDIHNRLTAGNEELNVEYNCKFLEKKPEEVNYDNIKENLKRQLEKNRETDIRKGYTGIGPHRDDLIITINGLDVERYGSQGQQRTAVLSLKLAELEILKEEIEDNPILLLDDVFSELDKDRREFLLDYIKELQVFITTTDNIDTANKQDILKRFHVVRGRVEEY